MESWIAHSLLALQIVLGSHVPARIPLPRLRRAFRRGTILRTADVPFPYVVIVPSGQIVITIPPAWECEDRLRTVLGMLDME